MSNTDPTNKPGVQKTQNQDKQSKTQKTKEMSNTDHTKIPGVYWGAREWYSRVCVQ